jgi:hypothetical protein
MQPEPRRVMELPIFPNRAHPYEVAEGVKPSLPGLYLWQIDGIDSYVSKYRHVSRPTKHYARNVRNLLADKPYRKGKPSRFRRIHHALADAVRAGRTVRLIILENVPVGDINRRERAVIKERGCALNGPVTAPLLF